MKRFVFIYPQPSKKAMIGTVLALFAAVTLGLSVILVRKHSTESNAFNISLIISLTGIAVLWPLAILLTDFGTINLEGLLLFAISGVLAPGLVRLLYYSGLKRLGAPVNASLFAIYPLYSSFLAVLLLSEILSLENWIGIILVIFGGTFVGTNSRKIKMGDKPSRKNLALPIVGGLALAVSSIIRKYALNLYNAPVLGVAIAYTFSLLSYFLMLMLSASTRKGLSLKRDLRFFWKAGIGQALSWILIFYALSYEQVSIVIPLLAIEPLFVAFFAYLYIRKLEYISPKLAVSMILTVFGVILVTTKL
jgi:drug/metabolite transporter (DMT)-like permease